MNLVEQEDKSVVYSFLDKMSIMRQLESSKVITITYRQLLPDSSVRRKKVRAFYLDELREDIIIAQRDITDLYQEEQEQKHILEAASMAKSDFLSRISHDMRTPLNGILGIAYLAKEKNDPDELKKDIKTIEASGQILLNLVNDTLDMSRIESGRIELHPEECNEKTVFDAVFTAIEPSLEKKDLRLHKSFIGIDWKRVVIDAPRVQQIFLNLFSNAIKFTPDGKDIYWTMECIEEREDYVIDRFTVRDTGIGMSEDFQKHMYEAFSQENRINTDQTMGTGLGLSIVKKIVDLMNGTITVKSEMDKGTEFCVTLRLPVVCSLRKLPTKAPLKTYSFSGKRILICEDNHLNSMIAVKLLEKAGCVVDTAENGQFGIDRFNRSLPGFYSAILMDIRMPELDGLEAARAIRALDRPDAKDVPIIAMSANAFAEDMQKSMDAGMNAHMSKPIDPQKLYELLAQQIGACTVEST